MDCENVIDFITTSKWGNSFKESIEYLYKDWCELKGFSYLPRRYYRKEKPSYIPRSTYMKYKLRETLCLRKRKTNKKDGKHQ